MTQHHRGENNPIRCSECGSAVAHDQCYCVECGARLRPLPRHVSGVIGGIMERGTRAPVATEPTAAQLDGDEGRDDAWLVAPRAAAVAVIGMLGFGVIVGSLVGASAASPLSQVIVEVPQHTAPTGTSPLGTAGATGGGGGGGGGGGTITVTTTTPAPATPTTAASAGTTSTTSTTPVSTNLPPIKHVFMVVLSDEGYNETFGHTANDPYLAKTLAREGELLINYYAVAGSPLANELALVSGQGPNAETAADCPTYDSFIASGLGADGQVLGSGCVFPSTAPSLADQLTAAKLTWKAYLQTKGSQKLARAEACRPRLGGSSGSPTAAQPYATWRNPFLFFSSLTSTKCPKANVPLGQLATDLKSVGTTPSLSYIVADACDDGSNVPCKAHAAAGMGPADAFLKRVIPAIKRSPAYKAGGLIAITFDNAPQTGPQADSSSCCGNPTYPNMLGAPTTSTTPTTPTTSTTTTTSTTPTTTTTSTTPTTTTGSTTTTGTTTTTTTTTTPTTTTTSTTPALSGGETNPTGGGGQVGLLLLSKYVKPNNPEVTDYYNHFSLLASIEKLFGLQRLGYASASGLPVFGTAVWDNYTPG